jgi:hypothetical protein
MRTILALQLTLWAASATAQALPEIPQNDVDAACARTASQQVAPFCVRQEQEAYDRLQEIWPLLSDYSRNDALRATKQIFGTANYYTGLFRYASGRLTIDQQQRSASSSPRFRP